MKTEIEGVVFSIAPKGQSVALEVGADGYIGEIVSECVLSLRAVISSGWKDCVLGISVDGKKNVALKKDLGWYNNLNETEGSGPAIYQSGIQVKSNGEVFHTEYPNNHLRLLVLGEAGNIQIWEVAIISQIGRFFVTEQKVWDTYCYRDNGRLTCPLFEGPKGWPQMVALLGDLLSDRLDELPPISKKRKEDPNRNDINIFAPNRGMVIWYNRAQMLGVIKTPEGTARAHWTNIRRNNGGPAYLKPGELVKYNQLVSPRLTKGRATTLKFDAVGIRPLG